MRRDEKVVYWKASVALKCVCKSGILIVGVLDFIKQRVRQHFAISAEQNLKDYCKHYLLCENNTGLVPNPPSGDNLRLWMSASIVNVRQRS